MATEKRCRKDRRDGYFLQELDGYHVFLPYLMPNRADCEAFINEQVDLTNLLAYLEQKNAANPGQRYTMFHVIAAAIAKTITLRPQMNRFISGKRIYQRKGISLSFVAKKEFSDHGRKACCTYQSAMKIRSTPSTPRSTMPFPRCAGAKRIIRSISSTFWQNCRAGCFAWLWGF